MANFVGETHAQNANVQVPGRINPETGRVEVDDSGGAAAAAHVMPARVSLEAATPTDVLAAGLATSYVLIVNVHADEVINVAFDGQDASSSHGHPLAAGAFIERTGKGVPTGKISAYAADAAADALSVEYA